MINIIYNSINLVKIWHFSANLFSIYTWKIQVTFLEYFFTGFYDICLLKQFNNVQRASLTHSCLKLLVDATTSHWSHVMAVLQHHRYRFISVDGRHCVHMFSLLLFSWSDFSQWHIFSDDGLEEILPQSLSTCSWVKPADQVWSNLLVNRCFSSYTRLVQLWEIGESDAINQINQIWIV